MVEVSSTLHYKLFIKITKNENSLPSLWAAVLHFIYEQLCQLIGYSDTFDAFLQTKQFETEDHVFKMVISSISKDNETMWAVRVRMYDGTQRRRNWNTHIGIRQKNDDDTCLYLFYAEYYADYVAGRFNSLPPPQKSVPLFVRSLINDTQYDCIVGGYQLPTFAIELDASILSAFFHLLDADDRKQPVVLLACTDCVDPTLLASALVGNVMVFYTYDFNIISYINQYMPEDLQTHIDAVHIYQRKIEGTFKMDTLHGEEVYRIGEQAFSESLRRAYCECFWSHEKRECITYDDIVIMQQQEELRMMKEQNANLSGQLDHLSGQLDKVSKKTSTTAALRQALRKSQEDSKACEELLFETAKRLEDLQQAVRSISNALHQEEGFASLCPTVYEDDCLTALIGAINIRFNPYGRRKIKKPAATGS